MIVDKLSELRLRAKVEVGVRSMSAMRLSSGEHGVRRTIVL
jgi:hypothetical protein